MIKNLLIKLVKKNITSALCLLNYLLNGNTNHKKPTHFQYHEIECGGYWIADHYEIYN